MGAEQQRAVILVSGGVDSATVLAIAKKTASKPIRSVSTTGSATNLN